MYSGLTEQLWKPRSSVKVRFALAQGVVVALIIGLLALTLYVPVKKRLVTLTNESYELLANNLSAGIYSEYLGGNRQAVVNAVRLVANQQGVRYVLVVDQNNKVYYDTISGDTSLEGKTYKDGLTDQTVHGDSVVGTVNRDGSPYYNYVSPIFLGNNVIYSVRIAVDQESIDGVFTQLSSLFINVAGLGILLGIIAAYILTARLTKPIIMLTESALAIRAGNLNAYANITTNDELEQLSREFQGMVEKLKQFYFQEYNQKRQALDAKQRLEEINYRLQQLDHQKSDFLNAASHQLRTPLSVIHWSLSLIVEEASHLNLTSAQQELLEEALKSTKRMVELVNDLLDISRIEQGRKELDWQYGNFGKVCKQLVNDLQVLAQQKNLQLVYQQDGDIPDSYLDEKAFYQVINNFVDNAVKYTPEGEVRVRCHQQAEHVIINIQDTGIGMTDQEKASLFTRFSRGSEASKLFTNGSGLGMYVAKSILVQHGGEISVESEHGKGTVFTLTLPIFNQIPNPAPVHAA